MSWITPPPFPNFGSKLGIDLTTRFPDEPPRGNPSDLPEPPSPEDIARIVADNITGAAACRTFLPDPPEGGGVINRILLITVQKQEAIGGKEISDSILDADLLPAFNIFILFDREIDIHNHSLMLWKIFNNVAPDRDIRMKNKRMVIDASRKGKMDGHEREWPDELRFDL